MRWEPLGRNQPDDELGHGVRPMDLRMVHAAVPGVTRLPIWSRQGHGNSLAEPQEDTLNGRTYGLMVAHQRLLVPQSSRLLRQNLICGHNLGT